MRDDDDDQLRSYMPLLRRIFILVAVLTAVPVILWTITAYVRSYVGPPELPTFRRLAATAPIEAPQGAAASQNAGAPPLAAAQPPAAPSDPLPTIVQARAATMAPTTDAPGQAPALNGPSPFGNRMTAGDAQAPASAPTIADATPAAPTGAVAKAAETPAAPATPDGTLQNTGPLAAQQPPAAGEPPADTPAATMPAAKPLSGPIPLPRHRPRDPAMAEMAVAQAAVPRMGVANMGVHMGVPLPRSRPDAAGPPAPETTATTPGPLDWLQGIFQPHQ